MWRAILIPNQRRTLRYSPFPSLSPVMRKRFAGRWWWWWCVVLAINGNGVSVQGRAYVQLIGWQNTWEQAPGVPPPLLRLNGGGQPWPCTCVHGPKKKPHQLRNLDCPMT